ncbi:MAG: hypothetical protein ACYDBT_04110 [Desulfobulbaceae bacterium]
MITVDTFINIESSIFGLASSVAFAIGTLALNSKGIQQIAGTYWNYNKYVADSLVKQKAQYAIGALYLAISFMFIGLKSIYAPKTLSYQINYIGNIYILSLVTIILIFCLSFLLFTVIKNFTSAQVQKSFDREEEDYQRRRNRR